MPTPSHPVLTDRKVVFLLALFCCLLWGSSYPAIKNGYALFGIAPADIASKLVFAGWRFAIAGLTLVGWAALGGKPMRGLGSRAWGRITLLGEGFVVIAAFVLAAASIYGKRVSQGIDPIVMTGWQLAIGGAALLAYLALLSSLAISIWSLLLKYNRVSLVTAFNFMVPVFGALLSAAFLGESILGWRNGLALVLVCYGIWRVTQSPAAQGAGFKDEVRIARR